MTTTTPTSGVTFASAAAMLAGHLTDHALPEPVSLNVTTSYGNPRELHQTGEKPQVAC